MFDLPDFDSWASLLGLLGPMEYFVTVDHSVLWQKHVAWAKPRGEKLRAYGIAPPVKASNSVRSLFGETVVACPRCASEDTERVSEFGSTACKALYKCQTCHEPFDYFKCI